MIRMIKAFLLVTAFCLVAANAQAQDHKPNTPENPQLNVAAFFEIGGGEYYLFFQNGEAEYYQICREAGNDKHYLVCRDDPIDDQILPIGDQFLEPEIENED